MKVASEDIFAYFFKLSGIRNLPSLSKLVGIISERDFLSIVGKHAKDWEDISVCDVMTKEVVTATPEDTLEQVMSQMTQHHIRHIPVMKNNKIVGVLAIGDIINALFDKTLFQNKLLKSYIKDWPKEKQ